MSLYLGAWNWVIQQIRLIEVLKTSKVLLLMWSLATRWVRQVISVPGEGHCHECAWRQSVTRQATECDPAGGRHHNSGSV